MTNFVPTKRNLQTLLFCFHLKKSAAESQQMLMVIIYTPSISTCEYWLRRYKKVIFDTEDKEYPCQSKKFEDEEALLEQNSNQTQEKLAKSLNVDRSTISFEGH